MKTLGLLITSLLTGLQIMHVNTVAAQNDSTGTFKIRKATGSMFSEQETVFQGEIFTVVEEMPQFLGEDAGLNRFTSRITYPELAKEQNIQGTVYVRFIIDELGKVTNVEIVRSVHPLLDEAAAEACRNMSDWKPGRQNGQAVKVQYVVPIKFSLN